jgi:hypothetical protein
MKTMPVDLKLAVHVNPGDTFQWSEVLLARASFSGTLELLTAAWERVLGYRRDEFQGKTLCQLMGSSRAAAADTVAALLDPENTAPVELTVLSRDGAAKGLRLHRRLDSYSGKIFIVAEETAAPAACAARQTASRPGVSLQGNRGE